jgi:ComF family protein
MRGLSALATVLGLYERRCPVCLMPFTPVRHAASIAASLLCPQCSPSLVRYSGARCAACAMPLPLGTPRGTLCGACACGLPLWSGITYYGVYAGVLRDLLLRFKLAHELSLAPVLAALMLESLPCLPAVDALVPIPQHPAHLRQRGYNQAHELARALAAQSAIVFFPRALQRVQNLPSQTTLSGRQRHNAPQGSFACLAPVQGKRLLIVDDICTTGGTLHHAALCLLSRGARAVYCATVARTTLYDSI